MKAQDPLEPFDHIGYGERTFTVFQRMGVGAGNIRMARREGVVRGGAGEALARAARSEPRSKRPASVSPGRRTRGPDYRHLPVTAGKSLGRNAGKSSARSSGQGSSPTSDKSAHASSEKPATRAAGPDHLQQRRRVQRVAEQLFAARGYQETSIHVVAARSQCSVGHLYNLYGNKLGLYRAILETKMVQLRLGAEQAVAPPTPVRHRLGELLRSVLGYFEENSAFFRIYAIESGTRIPRSNSPRAACFELLHDDPFGLVTRLLREGQDSGELRAEFDARLAAISLVGMIKEHATEWVLQREKGSLEARGKDILDLLLQGLSL